MSEYARQLLINGKSSARAGYHNQAQRYFERVIDAGDATHEQKAEAYVWLANMSEDESTKRDHLNSVIAYDPLNAEARRQLAILDGRLNVTEMVNPDAIESNTQDEPESVQARRFLCAQCGAPIPFVPRASELECSYCGHHQSLMESLKHTYTAVDHDFVVALATKTGHTVPENVLTYKCQGCQAVMMTSGQISDHCPYCGSPHVIKAETTAQVLPDGIIPFAVEQNEARRHFHEWLRQHLSKQQIRTTKMRGVYLPVWVFDMMGQLDYRIIEQQNQFNLTRANRSFIQELTDPVQAFPTLQSTSHAKSEPDGSHVFFADNLMVSATHKLPYKLIEILDTFDIKQVQDYNPAMLSGWPAEQYQITVADASLIARQRAVKTEWRETEFNAQLRVSSDSAEVRIVPRNLAVDTYRLWLLPLWFGNYRLEEDQTTYTVVVNGYDGTVRGERPRSGLGQWLDAIF